MQIATYSFSELNETSKRWVLAPFTLDRLNLIVGKNSSGKSRLINTISVLGQLLTFPPERLWRSGHWNASFAEGQDSYELSVAIDDHEVRLEEFKKNGKLLLTRGPDGRGKIFSEEVGRELGFQLSTNKLALNAKQDKIQHPFLDVLADWGTQLRKYSFGTDFGRTEIYAAPLKEMDSASEGTVRATDPKLIAKLYVEAFSRFGKEFDDSILADFRKVGYPCSDISCSEFEMSGAPFPHGHIPLVISVQEEELEAPTYQHDMSAGMYRALALLVNLHHSLRTGAKGTILIDDIGEGLDFERAAKLIEVVKDRCEEAQIQLVMTTNDRFIMNAVDLSHWHILLRKGQVITVKNARNAPESFSDFKFLGLSNFDFFRAESSEQKSK
jgi:hypothetical protein